MRQVGILDDKNKIVKVISKRTLEHNILRGIWRSNRVDETYPICKAFPFGRAFLLPLNIAVVAVPLIVLPIPHPPFL